MKLTTPTEVLALKLGDEQAVRLICKAGFDTIDYSMFLMTDPSNILCGNGYKAYILRLKAIADSYGCSFTQSHAPFPSYTEGATLYNDRIFTAILRSMEITSLLGAKTIVVHPITLENPQRQRELNLDFYNCLAPYCRDFGVTVALENMWNYKKGTQNIIPGAAGTGEEFIDYLDSLDKQYFTACLDLGHCGLVGESAPAMIRELGPQRLTALHVHDNDGMHDSHVYPYSGTMDWDGITAALHGIGYSGDFTFEADSTFEHYPKELLPEVLRLLHSIGRFLIQKIEQGAN